jgi:chromosomal replication initiator protein
VTNTPAVVDARTARLARALEDVQRLLHEHVDNTIGQIQNALIAVSASRVPLDSRLAEVALTDLVGGNEDVQLKASTVIAVTAEYFGFTTAEVIGGGRTKSLAHARQVAMYLCRELTDLSLLQLGARFERDHTTVMHAVRRIQTADDPRMARCLQDITVLIKRQAAMDALRGARDMDIPLHPQRRTG